MAKIKKRKLCWKASASTQVVGYKLYWSENSVLDYNSNCEMLGNVTEIILPDDVASFTPKAGPITFGVTAVDELGNESDFVTLAAPYQFNVPKAPDALHLQTLKDYYTSNAQQGKSDDDIEVNHDKSVESMKFTKQFDYEQINPEQNSEELDISKKFNLIIK
jgi:hypothetical protein